MLKFFVYGAVAFSMLSMSAQANDTPSTLNEWMDQARSAVEDKMEYPESNVFLGEIDTNTFVVTVNRQGDILEFTSRVKAEKGSFDYASRQALKNADLPDLPLSYKADTLKFNLVLDYIQYADDPSRLHAADNIQENQIAKISPESN